MLKSLYLYEGPDFEMFATMPIATYGTTENGKVSELGGLVRLEPIMIYHPFKIARKGNVHIFD